MKRQWWHGKVAYQIYPKSFYDSNGDGIGDLPGIIAKLDYLKDLGVDIVWLSPVYCSPLADQGYDISDYYNIDPRFGTMDDMDRLISEAKKRDMYIVLDLVVNHCSDEHEWFQKACADPEGEYGQYFYLQKLRKREPEEGAATVDGYILPCNWRSYFGGPVWEKLPGHEDWFYLHVFHKKQPDLNWENPLVRKEIYKMINWWLERGLAGFRIDAIINIKKALPFRNYRPDRADGLCDIRLMLQDAQGVGDFLGEMRDMTFKPHQAFTVGEVFNEKADELPLFIGENGYFSTMFDFSETLWGASPDGWHANKSITPDDYRGCLFEAQKKAADTGFLSNIIENHDEPRGVSRYIPAQDMLVMEPDMRLAAKKALATVYFFLKGLPWIYQGQELGMENVPLSSIDDVDDIASLDAWNVMLALGLSKEDALKAIGKTGRDNARTPFQWSGGPNAGFTTGTPWLRVNPNFEQINLEQQQEDPASVFHHYQKMIALRKDPRFQETLVYGSFEPWLPEEHKVIAYLRKTKTQTILVLSNYQMQARTLPLPAPMRRLLLDNCGPAEDPAADLTTDRAADPATDLTTVRAADPAADLKTVQTAERTTDPAADLKTERTEEKTAPPESTRAGQEAFYRLGGYQTVVLEL